MRAYTMLFSLIITLCACHSNKKPAIAFYHWKSKALYSATIKEALQMANTKTIYLHYFDVDTMQTQSYDTEGLYPVYALTKVDPEYAQYDIIPVVYITNNALKKANAENLSVRLHKLIDEISQFQFHKQYHIIQLDCDWTRTTRNNYFQLIRQLKKYYTVSVTIRLHQIKFIVETGIPPVDRGTLMLYNIGDLENEKQNSILESGIVSDYINASTTYPIDLDVALPLFSQTVLISKNNQIRIVNGADKNSIQKDSLHFRAFDQQLFEVLKDTLYNGFYLFPGYRLKLEAASEDEIIASYSIVKQSQLHLKDVLFYHLDDEAIQNIDLNRLIHRL
jgi:hypothetical protein